MLIQTKYRTEEEEIMDDFTLEGQELIDALDKIASINQFLGGNKLTIQGIKKIIQHHPKSTYTIIDVGCGNGDMLRTLADFAQKYNYQFQLIGVDANPFTIQYAKDLSKNYPMISYQCEDIFSQSFSQMNYDILLSTLTLHHFKNEQINYLTQLFTAQSRLGVVINDLHRSKVAYRLFQFICLVFNLNRMSKQDGLVSILRGFKKKEIQEFSKKLTVSKQTIHWKWAFRYQWIIFK
jgi:2-polyprenyl-3-methyl-5-hydroxy-6-metoxy-1,4-benzoquinol methylase